MAASFGFWAAVVNISSGSSSSACMAGFGFLLCIYLQFVLSFNMNSRLGDH